jgi:hypothetical protein
MEHCPIYEAGSGSPRQIVPVSVQTLTILDYSRGARAESRATQRLYRLNVYVVLLSSSRQMVGYNLKTGYAHFFA